MTLGEPERNSRVRREDSDKEILSCARLIITKEAQAVAEAAQHLGSTFVQAVEELLHCQGRVCVTGIGKAGIIGKKIQATLASTGTPSYTLHPVEALHGDLGMVRNDDVVIALSKSGGSEVAQLLPILKKLCRAIILITAEPNSTAAQFADCVLDIGAGAEACPLGLAPSSSTTAMLALGDALALTVMEQKAVQPEDYAANHPGGALGRALMKVQDIMRTGENCPSVISGSSLAECYEAMLHAPLRAGAVMIVDENGTLKGILTQGDIFRLIAGRSYDAAKSVDAFMTVNPKRIEAGQPALDALALMREFSIDELPVVKDGQRLAGLLDIQDLIRHGFPIADSAG